MGLFSEVFHMMEGLGWPVATHLSLTLSPSLTTMGDEEKMCSEPGEETKINF
jgi:hypothetical protein